MYDLVRKVEWNLEESAQGAETGISMGYEMRYLLHDCQVHPWIWLISPQGADATPYSIAAIRLPGKWPSLGAACSSQESRSARGSCDSVRSQQENAAREHVFAIRYRIPVRRLDV
jgi:hypothetical protein